MAYETTKIVKTLRFPGDTTNQYQVNAVALDGHTWQDIDDRFDTLESFDALRYMGTIAGSSTSPGAYTVAANKGDVYKVSTGGYVMGVKCEVGDMLICNTDGTAAATSSNYTTIASKWDIVQGNIDVSNLMNHTHTGDVTFSKSSKTLTHTVTPTKANITASFSSGTASVTGNHDHGISGSVESVSAGGTVESKSVTPAGTVKLSVPTTVDANDVTITTSGTVGNSSTEYVTGVTVGDHEAHTHGFTTGAADTDTVSGSVTIKTSTSGTTNYTPAGNVGNSSTAVTDVTAGDTTVSAHSVTSVSSAGGHTPEGTVTVNDATAGGSVESHKHNVGVQIGGNTNPVKSITTTYTAGSTDYDGTVTIGASTAAVTASVSESSVAPTFTGAAHSHTASFKGTAVNGHSHTVEIADHAAFVPVIDVTKGNHNHSFTGTPVRIYAEHSLAHAHTHGGTTNANTKGMAHSVTAPTSTHGHEFTGGSQSIHAAFTGTAASHNHTFTPTAHAHGVGTLDVGAYSGSFTGTSAGTVTVNVTEATDGKVLTGVTVGNHSISTVDSGSVTTGKGTQK